MKVNPQGPDSLRSGTTNVIKLLHNSNDGVFSTNLKSQFGFNFNFNFKLGVQVKVLWRLLVEVVVAVEHKI